MYDQHPFYAGLTVIFADIHFFIQVGFFNNFFLSQSLPDQNDRWLWNIR